MPRGRTSVAMLPRTLPVAFALLVTSVAGCAVRSDPAHAPSHSPEPRALPNHVVATSRTVLRLEEDRSVRLAFPRSELPLRVREVRDDEAVVEIDGGIRVSGVVKLVDLGVLACTPAPIGAHFYAGNGNLLSLRSTVQGDRVRVGGEVVVRQRTYADGMRLADQFRTIPFEAEVPTSLLCNATPPKRHAGSAEDPTVAHAYGEPDEEDFPKGTRLLDIEKGASLVLLDAPGGKPLHVLPATDWGFVVVWLKREGAFDLVAAGGGPYLLGWIPSREPRKDDEGYGGLGLLGSVGDVEGPMALHAKDLEALPLHKLPAGSELQQLGVVRATLMREGYGRVAGAPRGNWSYVIAAVDDDVTVEGWIETAKLGALVVRRGKAGR